MPSTSDADVKVAQFKFYGLVLTAIIGPLLAFYFAKSGADTNHSQSAKGYSLVAQMVNQHEQRLDALERRPAPATQPALTLDGPIIVPGGRIDTWRRIPVVARPPAKAPMKAATKVGVRVGDAGVGGGAAHTTVLIDPKYIAGGIAPASMPAKPAPRRAIQQLPARLRDIR